MHSEHEDLVTMIDLPPLQRKSGKDFLGKLARKEWGGLCGEDSPPCFLEGRQAPSPESGRTMLGSC